MAWDEVLRIAIPGTARRMAAAEAAQATPHDPTTELLDSAAIHAVMRRAGATPVPAPALRAPMPAEPRPVLPGRHWVAGERARFDLFLAALGERGVVAAPEVVPALLTAMANTPALQRWLPVLGVAGAWLAPHRDAWAFAAGADPASEGDSRPDNDARAHDAGADDARLDDGAAVESIGDQPWRAGSPDERQAWFFAQCERAPARAAVALREALTERGTKPDLRARLVETLAHSHGPMTTAEREELLEQARADRAPTVREAAIKGLASIGAPGFRARQIARAERWITISTGRRGALTITVALPTDPSDDDRRDGVEAPNTTGWVGYRHPWLTALPLAWWQERAGGARPEALVAAEIKGVDAADLTSAWVTRTTADRDPAWAIAFANHDWTAGARVAELLDPADAERLGLEALRAGDPGSAFLAGLAQPWPPRLLERFCRDLAAYAEHCPRRWTVVLQQVAERGDPRALELLPTDLAGPPHVTTELDRARTLLAWRSRLDSALAALDRAERPA